MLYEPPKAKQYILIGASVLVLAVLAIIIAPLIFKEKTTQAPTANFPLTAEQERIQKEFEKLEAMRKGANAKNPTPEEIQKEFDALEKQRAQSNATPPTPEQIQKEFEKLEQARK